MQEILFSLKEGDYVRARTADSFPAAGGPSGEEGVAVSPPSGGRFKGARPTRQASVTLTWPRYELDLQEAEPVILHRQFRRDSMGEESGMPVEAPSVGAQDSGAVVGGPFVTKAVACSSDSTEECMEIGRAHV